MTFILGVKSYVIMTCTEPFSITLLGILFLPNYVGDEIFPSEDAICKILKVSVLDVIAANKHRTII